MATLDMGVVEIAYSQTEENGTTISTTTGDVAEILEAKYHVMQYFFALRKEQIAHAVAVAMGDALTGLMRNKIRLGQGKKVQIPRNIMYGAEQMIESQFRSFLDSNEMQKLSVALTGMYISRAAAAAVNPRKKQPYAKKNNARPAFIATGLYRSSFRAQIKL